METENRPLIRTSSEVLTDFVRGAKRLRKKELGCGLMLDNHTACAFAVAWLQHVAPSGPIEPEEFEHYMYARTPLLLSAYASGAVNLINFNDNHQLPESKAQRYKRVLKAAKAELAIRG